MSRRRILQFFKHKHFYRVEASGTHAYYMRCDTCGQSEYFIKEFFWNGYPYNMRKNWFRTWLTDMKNGLHDVLIGR